MERYLSLLFLLLFISSCSSMKSSKETSDQKFAMNCAQGDYEKNIDLYLKQLRQTKNKASFYNKIGNCLAEAKDYSQAIYYYELAIESSKDHKNQQSIIFANIANSYLLTNNIDLAISNLEQSTILNPSASESFFRLGIIHFQLGDFKKSLTHLSKIRMPAEQNKELNYYMTANLLFLKKFKEARSQVVSINNDKSDEGHKFLTSALDILEGRNLKEQGALLKELKEIRISSSPLIAIKTFISDNYEQNNLQTSN